MKTLIAVLLGLRFCLSVGPLLAQTAVPEGLVFKEQVFPAGVVGEWKTYNAATSKGIPPQSNAGVWLVQLLGEKVFEEKLRDASLDLLGIQKLSESATRFVYFEEMYAKDIEGDPQFGPTAAEFLKASEELWTRRQHPILAQFLDRNGEALDELVRISGLKAYYVPLLSDDDPPGMMSASFAVERRLPFLAQCLCARALFKFRAGEFTESFRDLEACHRLAVLLATGSPLDVSGAKAHTIDALANRAERAIVESGRLTAEQATALLAMLRGLPKLPTAELAANLGERATIHQELENLKTADMKRETFFEAYMEKNPDGAKDLEAVKFDWNIALRRADELQDEIVKVLAMKDFAAQREQTRQLDEKYANWMARVDDEELKVVELAKSDAAAVSRWLGENFAMSLRTNLLQRQLTDQRAQVRSRMCELAVVLVLHQREQKDFPEKLNAAQLKVAESVLVDAYANVPFTYRRFGADRAALISWGPNQVDDAGQEFNDDVIWELK